MIRLLVFAAVCVVVPPLWGLAVEWGFRVFRGDRGSEYRGPDGTEQGGGRE
jgi:hypothetical protein